MSLTDLPHPALARPGITLPQIVTIVRPWRWVLALVAACVLAASMLELVPPLIIRRIVDDHLIPQDASGLLALALLYLGATAAVAALSFVTSYLMALAAQGALHSLRVRLFAHVQRLPVSYYDRTPLGETLSRCTADVETVDTLFSSGVANLVADLTRLGTVAVTMVLLSPPLALVAALVAPPLVWVTRFFQVRVRDAERANRHAVGLLNTRLQETLAGAEVIRAFHRQAFFIAAFRVALRQTLAAFNRAAVYSALYAPLMALLAAAATALLLWSGARGLFSAWEISLGTLTAFVLLFQRFFRRVADGPERAFRPGADRCRVGVTPGRSATTGGRAATGGGHRAAGGRLRIRSRPAGVARHLAGRADGGACGPGWPHGRGQEQRVASGRRPLCAVVRQRARRRRRPTHACRGRAPPCDRGGAPDSPVVQRQHP
jgi:hypothetical protein